jgi:hypothetical protein
MVIPGDCPSTSKVYPFFEIQLPNTFTLTNKTHPVIYRNPTIIYLDVL